MVNIAGMELDFSDPKVQIGAAVAGVIGAYALISGANKKKQIDPAEPVRATIAPAEGFSWSDIVGSNRGNAGGMPGYVGDAPGVNPGQPGRLRPGTPPGNGTTPTPPPDRFLPPEYRPPSGINPTNPNTRYATVEELARGISVQPGETVITPWGTKYENRNGNAVLNIGPQYQNPNAPKFGEPGYNDGSMPVGTIIGKMANGKDIIQAKTSPVSVQTAHFMNPAEEAQYKQSQAELNAQLKSQGFDRNEVSSAIKQSDGSYKVVTHEQYMDKEGDHRGRLAVKGNLNYGKYNSRTPPKLKVGGDVPALEATDPLNRRMYAGGSQYFDETTGQYTQVSGKISAARPKGSNLNPNPGGTIGGFRNTPQPIAMRKIDTLRSGETLEQFAKRNLGDARYAPQILSLNRGFKRFYSGQQLVIR